MELQTLGGSGYRSQTANPKRGGEKGWQSELHTGTIIVADIKYCAEMGWQSELHTAIIIVTGHITATANRRIETPSLQPLRRDSLADRVADMGIFWIQAPAKIVRQISYT